MKSILKHAASMKNPPKGYGSISTGMQVAEYRSKRMDFWAKQIGGGCYTPEVFDKVNADVIAKFGKAF